jgi:hypothetical protein
MNAHKSQTNDSLQRPVDGSRACSWVDFAAGVAHTPIVSAALPPNVAGMQPRLNRSNRANIAWRPKQIRLGNALP